MSFSNGSAQAPWGLVPLKKHASTALAVGGLRLWLKREETDWLFAIDRVPGDESAPPPPESDWRRIGAYPDLEALRLRPVFPPRAVVVRPRMPCAILPGERIQFFFGVPIWVALETPGGQRLAEEPIRILSNTWFGTPMEGELCYALRSRARRERDEVEIGPWSAICPVRVRNQSKELLKFERLCLRVQFLNLYLDRHEGLWSNESGITYRGDNDWSRLSHARGAPKHLRAAEEISPGREQAGGGFSLRALTDGGGFFQ